MSVISGRSSVAVSSAYVNSVNITGGTVLSQGNASNGGFAVSFQHNLGGCGGAESGIFVELKDTIAWTGISFRMTLIGQAACWSFANSPGYGLVPGFNTTGNLSTYDTSQGDQISISYLAQQTPPFNTHDPVYACDNNADNFMNFNTSTYRYFTMKRRRNVNGSLAGIATGRSCNSTGSGSITIIDNIFIWL
jgi:hypothetical protein